MSRTDPHSYFDDTQPRTRRLDLDLTVDFAARCLHGTATLTFGSGQSGRVDLDTRGLQVAAVRTANGRPVDFSIGPEDPILGRYLRVELPRDTASITVQYRTAPDATGLQWLEPAQTAGGRHPFLFSQCQAIHARSVAPLQDSPVARIAYGAALTVPRELAAVMSAESTATSAASADHRTFRFEMPQPIPPYLLALAVGNIASRDLSPRSRVWAEPEVIDAAAWEFAAVESMITTAEGLFGPYDWQRYDLLVLPPSFPYGGMENPRMTFVTPSLLAGDRSLVDVVAHELAHSWTGNLVTNANAEHFWLNEGWTVWAERRILEALHGPEAAALSWVLGATSLRQSLDRLGVDSPLTRLRTHLDNVDPDEIFSTVPYEKGARFLALLEATVGRERFDPFVRAYMRRFRFTSITTEQWLEFVAAELPGALETIGARDWIEGTGLPANAPRFHAPVLDAIEAQVADWAAGRGGQSAPQPAWNSTELQVFLQRLPRPLPAASCAELESAFGLAAPRNAEIRCEWLTIAAASDYEPAFDAIRAFLCGIGRMKYLRPLYTALGATPRTRALARAVFADAASRYHVTARRMVERLIG